MKHHAAAKKLLKSVALGVRHDLSAPGWTTVPDSVRPSANASDEVGWMTTISTRARGAGSLALFLDTYLGDERRYDLGCFYTAGERSVASAATAVSRAWGRRTLRRFTPGHRNDTARLSIEDGRSVLDALDKPFVDVGYVDGRSRWGFVGLYVASDALTTDETVLIADTLRIAHKLMSAIASAHTSAERAQAVADARERRTVEVLAREQAAFRAALFKDFDTCVITGERCKDVLEAAHILPVGRGHNGSDHPDNGLLLRADLHRLFDAGLLWIDGAHRVRIHTRVTSHSQQYADLDGKPLALRIGKGRQSALAGHARDCMRRDRWAAT